MKTYKEKAVERANEIVLKYNLKGIIRCAPWFYLYLIILAKENAIDAFIKNTISFNTLNRETILEMKWSQDIWYGTRAFFFTWCETKEGRPFWEKIAYKYPMTQPSRGGKNVLLADINQMFKQYVKGL